MSYRPFQCAYQNCRPPSIDEMFTPPAKQNPPPSFPTPPVFQKPPFVPPTNQQPPQTWQSPPEQPPQNWQSPPEQQTGNWQLAPVKPISNWQPTPEQPPQNWQDPNGGGSMFSSGELSAPIAPSASALSLQAITEQSAPYQNPKLVDFRGAVQPIGDVGVIGPQRTVIRGDSLEMMFNPSGCKRCFSSRNY